MKKIALAMIFVGLIIAFNSCAWRVPEHITVKSKADYSFSLGTYEKELNSSDMDMGTLMGNSLSGDVAVYDYFPGRSGATTQHYLLKVTLYEQTLMNTDQVEALTGDSYTIPASGSVSDTINTGFNPSSILSAMTTAFGESVDGKIEFESVPAYVYCKATTGISATATISLGSVDLVNNGTIENCEMPVFTDGETVYTNLASSDYIAQSSLETLINNASSSLSINYSISGLGGTITKANALADGGVKFGIYAIIDVPLSFHVTGDLEMNLIDMTGGNSSSSGSDSNSSDMTKYTEIIEAVSIKYIAYSLPFYSTSGINLGIDMLGTATSDTGFEWAALTVSNTEQQTLNLPYSTVRAMRSNLNFHPNIKIKIYDGAHFSVPRDRSVRINVEMHFSTDGKIKVK